MMEAESPKPSSWRWKVLLAGWLIPLAVLGVYVSRETPPQVAWVPEAPLELAAAVEEAEALVRAGALAEALNAYERLRARAPLDPLLLARLADLYRLKGDRTQAAAALTLALERDPALGEAAYNLACDRAVLGQTADALDALRLAIASGLDVRTALAQDAELAPLRSQAVVQRYLAGASTLPETERTGRLVRPAAPVHAQEPFTLTFELEASGSALSSTPLEVRLVYAGDASSGPRVQRLDQTLERTRGSEGGGWERLRWAVTLRAEQEGLLLLGPWSLVLNGVQVPMRSELLVIVPPRTQLPEALAQRDPASRDGKSEGSSGTAPAETTPAATPAPLPPEARLDALLRLELPPPSGP